MDAGGGGIGGIGFGAASVETRGEALKEGAGDGARVMALLLLTKLVNEGVEGNRFGVVGAVRPFDRGKSVIHDVGDHVAGLEWDGGEGGVEVGGGHVELHDDFCFCFGFCFCFLF